MIITRTPHRISFAGGGTDFQDFYLKHGGAVVSTTIDKYVYISMNRPFDFNKIVVKYSGLEEVSEVSLIQHKIFREVLSTYGINNVEINSNADIPCGTGLGSSSSFTVGLLGAILKEKIGDKDLLAKLACNIEIDKLGEPIGVQDQYAASFGGMNIIEFLDDGQIFVSPIKISEETSATLNNRLLLFYTGKTRSASVILKEQKACIYSKEESLIEMKKYAYETKVALESGNLDKFADVMMDNWYLKRDLANGVTNIEIDSIIETGLQNGAKSGRLNGGGSQGFVMFYCEEKDQDRLRQSMNGLKELEFNFENNGVEVIYDNE